MRLLERDLSTVYLRKMTIERDEEGEKVEAYGMPVELRMNVQSAGGVISAQIYGEKLPYIKTCKYQGNLIKAGKNELDGVCVDVSKDNEPDYFIKSIQPFSEHLNITLEKRVQP